MFTWIKSKLDQFEAWSATWLPGAKTKIIAGSGVLLMTVASMQDMVTGLPLDQLISPIKLALLNGGLFLTAYWTKRLSDLKE